MKNVPEFEATLEKLIHQVDSLIRHCEQLKNENHQLKSQHTQLLEDKSILMEKNNDAKLKVSQIIEKLKATNISS